MASNLGIPADMNEQIEMGRCQERVVQRVLSSVRFRRRGHYYLVRADVPVEDILQYLRSDSFATEIALPFVVVPGEYRPVEWTMDEYFYLCLRAHRLEPSVSQKALLDYGISSSEGAIVVREEDLLEPGLVGAKCDLTVGYGKLFKLMLDLV